MANRVTGKVQRLYATRGRCFIRLHGLSSANKPKDGYFKLEMSHDNYNALYSLVLSAAVNRHDLLIRTVDQISNNSHAEVEYMWVEW